PNRPISRSSAMLSGFWASMLTGRSETEARSRECRRTAFSWAMALGGVSLTIRARATPFRIPEGGGCSERDERDGWVAVFGGVQRFLLNTTRGRAGPA